MLDKLINDILIYLKENLKNLRISKAFTLAEVLIVLGIIGIIAESTIPTLVSKTQEAEYKASAKKAFMVSASAVEKMKYDEGGSLDYYVKNNGTFWSGLVKYFKTINCPECVGTNYASLLDIKTNSGIYFMDDGRFVTSDGMYFAIQNCYSAVQYGGCGPWLGITVDVNGYEKKPNQFGKDTFMFEVVNDSLVPMGGNGTAFPSDTYCTKTSTDQYNGLGCMALVMQGINY